MAHRATTWRNLLAQIENDLSVGLCSVCNGQGIDGSTYIIHDGEPMPADAGGCPECGKLSSLASVVVLHDRQAPLVQQDIDDQGEMENRPRGK